MDRHSVRWSLGCLLLLCLSAGTANAQRKEDQATIEVETVRPHPSALLHNNFAFRRNRFELEDQSILKLIAFAYGINPKQVVGTPQWVSSKHWDVAGTTNLIEDATFSQEQQLIQQLLVKRFGLKFHSEQRDMSAYALQIVKGGPILPAAATPGAQPFEHTEGAPGQQSEVYTSTTTTYFLAIRQLFMDRPLVDQTGLRGTYDFRLKYSHADLPSDDPEMPPAMFTAIKEQLGLKFEPVKVAVKVMVVEHIEEPFDN